MVTYYYNAPYLQGEVEQREFGWTTSKIVRPLKSKIGRGRRALADKIYEKSDISKLMKTAEDAQRQLETNAVRNKELRNKILRTEAPKAKTTVSYKASGLASGGGIGTTFFRKGVESGVGRVTGNEFIPKKDKEILKKIVKKKDRASGIAMTKEAGEDSLAHELGHAKGRVSTGRRKRISDRDPRNSANYSGSVSVYAKSMPGERVSFKDSVKDYIANSKNSRAIIAEEKAASKSALEMMKKAGATKEELRRAKKNLKKAGETYKVQGKTSRRSSLGRIIDIPSRRGTGVVIT